MFFVATFRVVMVGEMNAEKEESYYLIPGDTLYDDAIMYSYSGWKKTSQKGKDRIVAYLNGKTKSRVPFKNILSDSISGAVIKNNKVVPTKLYHFRVKIFNTAAPQVICYCHTDGQMSLNELYKQYDEAMCYWFRAGENNLILENIRIVKSRKYKCYTC